MEMRVWQWLIALAIALTIHLGALAYIPKDNDEPDKVHAPAGVEIVLAGSPKRVKEEAEEEPVERHKKESRSESEAEPQPDPKPDPKPEPEPEPEPEPDPEPEPKPEPKPDPEPEPEPKPDPEPEPEPEPKPDPEPEPESRQKPEPEPEQKPESGPQKTELQALDEDTIPQLPEADKLVKAQPKEGKPGTEADVTDSYLAKIYAALQSERRYPRSAVRRRLEGRVELSFIIDSEGTVEDWEIVSKSGYTILDEEVERMIKTVQIPSIPADEGVERLRLTVPIEFRLR